VEKGFSMKVFYSILALALSFICMIYLLLCPQNEHFAFHNFSTKALAAQSKHNTLTNAFALSTETTYQEHIAAHDKRYYYIPFQKNTNFQIMSNTIHSLKIIFLSETGKIISYNTKKSKKSKILTLPANSLGNGKRIFLFLTNQSTSSCSLQIYVSCNKNHCTKTPEPTKKKSRTTTPSKEISTDTINIPRPKINNKTTSYPAQYKTKQKPHSSHKANKITNNPYIQENKIQKKLSTKRSNIIKLYPQFLKMTPNSSKKLTLSPNQNTSDFIWLSSNPLTATVKNGKIHAIKEGIAIIYIHQKNHPKISSSCFIRVIERT